MHLPRRIVSSDPSSIFEAYKGRNWVFGDTDSRVDKLVVSRKLNEIQTQCSFF